MLEPTYRQALASAWQLVWRHKSLWVLGLLAIFVGHLGVSNFIGYIWAIADRGVVEPAALTFPQMIINLPDQSWTTIIAMLWAVGVMVVLGIMVIFLGLVSQGALIAYAADWYKKGKANMSKAWDKGVKHFWRILGIELIEKLLLGGILVVFGRGLQMFLTSDSFGYAALMAVLLALTALLGLVVIAATIYALGYVVIEEEELMPALMKGLTLFWHHLLVSFEVSIVLMVVDLVVLPIVGAGVFVAFLPALAIWITSGFANNSELMGFGIFAGMVLWSIFIVIVGAVFNAFATNAWMYLFMKMHGEGVRSRVMHWMQRISVRNPKSQIPSSK